MLRYQAEHQLESCQHAVAVAAQLLVLVLAVAAQVLVMVLAL